MSLHKKVSKKRKLIALGIENHSTLSDEYVDTLYTTHIINKKNDYKPIKKKKVIEIDKTTKKYKVLLKLVNRLLLAMKKDEIEDLLEFQLIDRKEIVSCDKNIIKKLEPKLFKAFKKGHCFYRKQAPSYNLNILKYLIKEIGMKMLRKQKNIHTSENNKLYVKTHAYYSIII